MNLETEFKIPIPDSKLNIYGKQYGNLDKPVILFVHGLTGHMDEHLFYNGARYFHKEGFSSVRFDLYGFQDDARNLIDCTLQIHGQDINTIQFYLKDKGAETIFAVGHSYGGPSILFSDQDFLKGAAFWDSVSNFSFTGESDHIVEIDAYRLQWGVDHLIGKGMYEEAEKLSWDEVIQKAKVPLKLIAAGNNEWVAEHERIHKSMKGENSLVTIDGATHTFSEEGVAEKLFDETISWLQELV